MKVLLVHNHYRSSAPSGESAVFYAEKEMLENNGVEVVTFEKENDDIVNLSNTEKLLFPFRLLWSKEIYDEMSNLLKIEQPDVVHFHNIFYMISPSAWYACKNEGIPVVQTLHNFRFFCVNGLFFRNGNICEDCLKTYPWRGVIHKCFRHSAVFSFMVFMMSVYHRNRGAFNEAVDVFIALTEFARNKYIKAGLKPEKLAVKPNFIYAAAQTIKENEGDYALFLGRLSEGKGLFTLLEAWKDFKELPLKIAGDGPLKIHLLNYIRQYNINNVELLGRVPNLKVHDLIRGAKFVILPSQVYESFPVVIVEAFANGKPIIASKIGAMESLIEDGKTGLHFEPGVAFDLVNKIKWMISNKDKCREMGYNARVEFLKEYTAERNYDKMMDIYEYVINLNSQKKLSVMQKKKEGQ